MRKVILALTATLATIGGGGLPVLAGALPSAWAAAPMPRDDAAIVATSRAIIDAYAELGWFSGSVLVAHGGEPILELSVGMADREAGTPNTRKTRYNLGSIMKHFTAVLVLQQVEAGTLSLDDRLAKFALGFPPETAARVTVRHLLHHRWGFPMCSPPRTAQTRWPSTRLRRSWTCCGMPRCCSSPAAITAIRTTVTSCSARSWSE